ncbi:Slp family lipoprotein [Alkalilimnicola ehrlichii]|uniref:Slp family lipoprotein n=1 Tax=Alkalilimnicola ehrlichii TaxID=351052 RepID=UPI003B9F0880
MRPIWLMLLSLLGLLLAACAAGPRYGTEAVNMDLTPLGVAAEPEAFTGERVVWGGIIVASENLKDSTRMEVLSYPLDRSQRPRTERSPQGRFLVSQPGYVETADYAPGRQITLSGRVEEVIDGRIGEADYRYPRVIPDDLYLWQREAGPAQSGPRVRFGVGIILTN